MAGKVLFLDGPHASRTGYRGQVTDADWSKLRKATPAYVGDGTVAELLKAVTLNTADAAREASHVPLRDQLAQLKKLVRLKGERLNIALFNLDQNTLEHIKAADRAAIQQVIDADGVFVDADGEQHTYCPPSIQIARPAKVSRSITNDYGDIVIVAAAMGTQGYAWFPRGTDGFVKSVKAVIAELELRKDSAGRREKGWQDELAKLIVTFWQTHCPNEPQSANRQSKTGKASPIVNFAMRVFDASGFRVVLSESRVANLLLAQQEKVSN